MSKPSVRVWLNFVRVKEESGQKEEVMAKHKYALITNVERQDDWRFFDLTIEIYDEPPKISQCCSVCNIRGQEPLEVWGIALPYKYIRRILGKDNGQT